MSKSKGGSKLKERERERERDNIAHLLSESRSQFKKLVERNILILKINQVTID